MNCLLLKQSFFTKELQAGCLERMSPLKEVQRDIQEWYQTESRKVVLQSRVEDVQQSEKVRQGKELSKSQRTSLMVFRAKPKQVTSLKPSDKR